jgi:hypothetical protein
MNLVDGPRLGHPCTLPHGRCHWRDTFRYNWTVCRLLMFTVTNCSLYGLGECCVRKLCLGQEDRTCDCHTYVTPTSL